MTLAELARGLNLSTRLGGGLPPLLLLSDARRLPDPAAAMAALPRGSGVILRNYDEPGRAALAARLARLSRGLGLYFMVAADIGLAARVGADGVHFPEALAGRAPAGRRLRPDWLITVSAHGAAGLAKAARVGADAAILGPVFPTASHPGAPALGVLRFAALARGSALPVYALGGVDENTGRRLRGSGAVGLAAIGALAAAV